MTHFKVVAKWILLVALFPLVPAPNVFDVSTTMKVIDALKKATDCSIEFNQFAQANDMLFLIARFYAEEAVKVANMNRSAEPILENGIEVVYIQTGQELPFPSGQANPTVLIFQRTELAQIENAANIISSSPSLTYAWKKELAQMGVYSIEMEPDQTLASLNQNSYFQTVVVFFPVPLSLKIKQLPGWNLDNQVKVITEKKAARLAISENLPAPSPREEFHVLLEESEMKMDPLAVPGIKHKIDIIADAALLGTVPNAGVAYIQHLKWNSDKRMIVPTDINHCIIFYRLAKVVGNRPPTPLNARRHGHNSNQASLSRAATNQYIPRQNQNRNYGTFNTTPSGRPLQQ